MTEKKSTRDISIGKYLELKSEDKIVLNIDGLQVGVYFLDDEIRAWHNVCPHSGGPVCQGRTMPLTLQSVDENKKSLGLNYSKTKQNLVCPWHGAEFDILTGRHPINTTIRLRALPINIVDGEVILTINA